MLISLAEAKQYLRIDTQEEDALIGVLLSSARRLCVDVSRLTDALWEAGDSDSPDDTLAPIREVMKVAILYALAYLYEHREKADHHALMLTLRSLLFGIREGVI